MPTLKDLHITPVTMDNDTDALNKKVDAQNATDLKGNKTSKDNNIKFGKGDVNNVIDSKNLTGSKDLSKLSEAILNIPQYDVTESDLKNNKTSKDNNIIFGAGETDNVIDPKNLVGGKKITNTNIIDSKNITGRKKITDMNVNYSK